MSKTSLLRIYKIPILISITLSIVLITLKLEHNSMAFAQIIFGALVGTFFLDLDYIIHALFLEPNDEFSKSYLGYFKHKDILGAFVFAHFNKHSIQEKILNSALFQMVIGAASIFVSASSTGLLIKALIASAFLNSFYKMMEFYFDGKKDEWFWALKTKPNNKMFWIYATVLFGFFVYSLSFF